MNGHNSRRKGVKKEQTVFPVFHPLFLSLCEISEDKALSLLLVSVSDWHRLCTVGLQARGSSQWHQHPVTIRTIGWPEPPQHREQKTQFYTHSQLPALNIWTLETTIFSHQKCFYKSPFPYFRFQDCETDPRSLPSSCLIVKYNTSIIFNIRNSLIRTIPKLRPPLPSHIHIWSEILQL